MIRIYVGVEPEALAEAREQHLAKAVLARPDARELGGYGNASDTLRAAHQYRCAYCETWMRGSSGEIEHYRPKGETFDVDWTATEAALTPPRDDTDDDGDRVARGLPPAHRDRVLWTKGRRGYWWLAWTWENLLWACGGCNSASNKGTRFPLRSGSPTLRGPARPKRDEEPLLLDPCREDPMDHLVYRKIDDEHWQLFARGSSPKGDWTIAVLGLNQPDMRDRYRTHVRRLNDATRTERDVLVDTAPHDERQQAWRDLCDLVLAPTNELLALGHDWINLRWPKKVRDAWGVTLVRPALCAPGTTQQATVRPRLTDRPELAALPARLAL